MLIATTSGCSGIGFLGSSGIEMSDALVGRCASAPIEWFLASGTCRSGRATAGSC